MDKSTVIILVGPTASGKTAVAVELALMTGGEVVSADSRQVYRYMDIGTDKPSEGELKGVPHYGFDVVNPDEWYSAGRFSEEARSWISDIQSRDRQAIVTGGSGMYLHALVDGFFEGDVKDREVRSSLEHRIEQDGLNTLYNELTRLDPEYAAKIQPGDRQRILRALQVTYASGIPFSQLHQSQRNRADFKARWFGLDWPREKLYSRIDMRVDLMFDRGLPAEVNNLLDRGYQESNALKSVGYEELMCLYKGYIEDIDTAKELIRRNTRRYAKRQLTWFRRDKRITWLAAGKGSPRGIAEKLLDQLSEKPAN